VSGRLAGKKALVTGAGSGIGLAIAARFASEGAQVEVCDRDEHGKPALAAAGVGFSLCDVADADAVTSWVAAAVSRLGGLDIVVANAGYELLGDARELDLEQWDAHQAVMLRGVFVTFKAALEHMVDSGQAGSLVATGSNLSFAAIPRFTSYLAAKAGVIGLVRGLAVDFAQHGIRVNAVCPGPTMTPLIERQLADATDPDGALAEWAGATILKRLGRPEEIAAAALFLAGDEASFVTGSALMVDGGYTAL
jgi:NAD(P)-dependent dehydrogenase (short-subunit alcohol dehydrogenase family)